VTEQTGGNPGWILLLSYEASWALGNWEKALSLVQSAIEVTRDSDPQVYAKALLALGRLQLNRRDYHVALQTISKAEDALVEVSDYDLSA
jgi:tetratricopeptide (TPR) repeat protein